MWYWQGTVKAWLCHSNDVFLVLSEVHFGVCSYLFKHQSYHLLLLGWKKNVTTFAFEIWVASEMENEGCHELVILLRVHPLLEFSESSGENQIHYVQTCYPLRLIGQVSPTGKIRWPMVTVMIEQGNRENIKEHLHPLEWKMLFYIFSIPL